MNKFLARSYLGLIYAFLYLPLLIVILFSFNQSEHSLIWHGFSIHWYQKLIHDQDLITIALHSLLLALLAASFATLLGMVSAVALYRYRFLGKDLLQMLIFVMIALPDLVIAIALLTLFSFVHLPLGFFSLLIAHIAFCLPFSCVLIANHLSGINRNLFEASIDLGASEGQLYRHVILPLLWPSLAASWLLSFTLSVDDVMISYFVSGPGFEILPLKIFSMVKMGVSPEINALSTVVLAFTLLLSLTAQFFLRRK